MTSETILISNIKKYPGKQVTIKGWVYNKRLGGALIFLQMRDGSGFIQGTVVKGEVSEEVFNKAAGTTLETSMEITGLVREEKRAVGGYEILVKDVKIISLSVEYPIGKKEHGPDFLLKNRHLWLRSKKQWAILRIRNEIILGINQFLQDNSYLKIDSPIITPAACEGTTTLFEIDYFGDKGYLSQSGQLYLEAAIASVGRCYDFGPVFRAEKSKTRRHLVEFWMMDAEAAFMEFAEMLAFEEKYIYYLIQRVLQNCQTELEIIERDQTPLKNIKTPFIRLRYEDAVMKLQALGSDIKMGTDFGNDDETILMTHYKQPVFVTHFPAEVKAFYAKREKDNEKYALSADLLAPEGYGEITGGGEREADYDILLKRIEEHHFNKNDYDWYLDSRKYGSVPHSGFGIGLERIVAWICKLDHVRESIPFPRMLERCYP